MLTAQAHTSGFEPRGAGPDCVRCYARYASRWYLWSAKKKIAYRSIDFLRSTTATSGRVFGY